MKTYRATYLTESGVPHPISLHAHDWNTALATALNHTLARVRQALGEQVKLTGLEIA